MDVRGDPVALGELLRSRRERLQPADVGLPPGERRRTAGLRREEVAALAHLSPTYYTYLEQGRPVRPSEAVLDALAAALRLDAAERHYLQVLAHGPGAGNPDPDDEISPDVVDLVERLDPSPTYVKSRRWDVLAANAAARALFWDGATAPPPDGNLVRWMFTCDHAREVYVDWEGEARAMLARFRLAVARHPDDPVVDALVADLVAASEQVRRWWPDHDVAGVGSGVKDLRHPVHGPTRYRHVVLTVADSPGQTLVTFTAD